MMKNSIIKRKQVALFFILIIQITIFTSLLPQSVIEIKKIENKVNIFNDNQILNEELIQFQENLKTQSEDYPKYGLYSCNWDGTNFTRIFGSDDIFIIDGMISPDESKILFRTYKDVTGDGKIDEYDDILGTEVAIMNANGTNMKFLTNDSYIDALPLWSPDGTQILWTTTRFSDGDNLDIAIMDVNGSNAYNITGHSEHESDPSWVNDKVIYTRNYSIWMMYDNGSDQTQLTDSLLRGQVHPYDSIWKYGDYDPDLSPDETMIAFERLQNDTNPIEFDLFVANISSEWVVTGEEDLSKNNWSDAIPQFSPDSKKIAFWTSNIPLSDPKYKDNFGEMFIINATGDDRARIDVDFHPPHIYYDLTFIKQNPSWFPSVTWEIDSQPDILFGGQFHGEWVPPVFLDVRPDDMVFPVGTEGQKIIWNVSDSDPDNYTILMNGEEHLTSDWDGREIIIDLDPLSRGSYQINITIFDQSNHILTDSVDVNIIESTTFPTEMIVLVVTAIGIIAIAVIIAKQRKDK